MAHHERIVIAAMVALAIAAWAAVGVDTSGLSVTTAEDDAPSPFIAWSQHTGSDCVVTVTAPFFTYGADLQQTVIDHEVGHCLGLHHVAVGIMRATLDGVLAPTRADVARQHPRGAVTMESYDGR